MPSIFKTLGGRDAFTASYERVLSGWPAPFRTMFAPTSFGPTHVIANGPEDAPPLVLLSGAGTSSTIWRPNVAGLRESLYNLGAAIARAERLLSEFKAAVVPEAGHVVNIDQPEKVNACILRFLAA